MERIKSVNAGHATVSHMKILTVPELAPVSCFTVISFVLRVSLFVCKLCTVRVMAVYRVID